MNRSVNRRQLLAGATATVLAGCSHLPAASDTLVDPHDGRHVRLDATAWQRLLDRVLAADVVLLGELHDNPLHHARRGQLLAELGLRPGARPVLVAEHLPRGRTRAADAGESPSHDLLARLQAAGFDDKGWRWPLHRDLFLPVAGLPLVGGNAPTDLVRRVARGDEAAVPDEVRTLLRDAALPPAAQQRLDQALLDGHCGHLSATRLPAMRQAQRVRDACMALALVQAGGSPAVLLAGNGHVRRDHGVPAYLATLRPTAKVLSIGLVEPGTAPDPAYDLMWETAAATRSDPCAGFKGLPR